MSARRAYLTVVPIAAVVNIVLGILDQALHLPIFLDAVGTAVAALALGPWGGMLAGIIGQLVTAFAFHPVALFFTPVNLATAVVWGVGGRLGLARTWPKAFLLGVAVALAASIVTAPTVVAVFGGAAPGLSGFFTFVLTASGMGVLAAAFLSNLGWSLLDKVLSTFLALAILRALAQARLLPEASGAAGGRA
ncbi:MAG: hypothetical protein IRZ11_04115 [Clostridia bacterium]|nr:hypothetical protein [Clostridia bacterium]